MFSHIFSVLMKLGVLIFIILERLGKIKSLSYIKRVHFIALRKIFTNEKVIMKLYLIVIKICILKLKSFPMALSQHGVQFPQCWCHILPKNDVMKLEFIYIVCLIQDVDFIIFLLKNTLFLLLQRNF